MTISLAPESLTVYTKHGCVQCRMVKRLLDKEGVEYDVVNIENDVDGYNFVVGLGFASVPVVVSGRGAVAGFAPDKIRALI